MSGMRVFGLGSGMDIDQMVSDMMKVEKARRLTKLDQKKQIDIWQKELYQEMNKDMASFIVDMKKDFGLSGTTSSGTLYNKSTDSFTWVKSASSSDETKLTASATAKAINGSYKLDVVQLAESVSKTSTGAVTTGTAGTLFQQFGDAFDNDATVGNDNDDLRFTLKTNLTDAAGEDFVFDPSVDSIDTIVQEINNANIGITAAYDVDLDRFFLNTSSTGSENYFQVLSDEDNFLSGSVGDGTDNKLKLNIKTLDVNDGIDLTFNFGDAIGLTKSSNTFSVNGINMIAKSTGVTTVTVDTDVDGVYDKITSFVEKYNELIGKLNGELSEKVYRDYKPLSDEEKESMTEDQIKKWEEAAKSGLLKNDSILSRIISDTRQGLYTSVSGLSSSMNHLTQIGIETGDYSNKGKLEINETKLKQAIIDNSSGVIDLLFKQPSDDLNTDDSNLTNEQIKEKHDQSGLVNRMFNSMVNGMKSIIDKAGPGDDSNLLRNVRSNILIDFTTGKNLINGSVSMLDQGLLGLEKNISRQEAMLARIEDRYYSQFSAMESALNRMNQQSNWLASQLGQM